MMITLIIVFELCFHALQMLKLHFLLLKELGKDQINGAKLIQIGKIVLMDE